MGLTLLQGDTLTPRPLSSIHHCIVTCNTRWHLGTTARVRQSSILSRLAFAFSLHRFFLSLSPFPLRWCTLNPISQSKHRLSIPLPSSNRTTATWPTPTSVSTADQRSIFKRRNGVIQCFIPSTDLCTSSLLRNDVCVLLGGEKLGRKYDFELFVLGAT